MQRRIAIFIVSGFFLVFFLNFSMPAEATDLTNCSVLDSAGTVYYLTQNITDSTNTTCINITANNITFDCQGHTIDGIDTADTHGIHILRTSTTDTNATVKNCNLTDWGESVYISKSRRNVFDNINISSCYPFGAGFNLDATSDYNNFTNISVSSCYRGFLFYDSEYNILDNVNLSSGLNGIYGRPEHCTIRNSIIEGFQYGFYSDGSFNNHFYNNLFNNTVNTKFTCAILANRWNTTNQTGTRIYSSGTQIGGNYWTNSTGNDYSDTCTDADYDGFCDDSYTLEVTEANIDFLPLSDEQDKMPWSNIVDVIIQEKSGNALTDYPVPINISYRSGMQADFDDLRFFDTDNSTELDYYLEYKVDSSWAYIWVEIPSMTANEIKEIWMYYNNTNINSASNGTGTFTFFDDFSDGSLNSYFNSSTSGTGVITETGGVVWINSSTANDYSVLSTNQTMTNYSIVYNWIATPAASYSTSAIQNDTWANSPNSAAYFDVHRRLHSGYLQVSDKSFLRMRISKLNTTNYSVERRNSTDFSLISNNTYPSLQDGEPDHWGCCDPWNGAHYSTNSIDNFFQAKYVYPEPEIYAIGTNLRLKTYDENNFTAGPICFDLLIYNETQSYDDYDICGEFVSTWGDVPSGNITVVVKNDTYTDRVYYLTLTEESSIKLNAYLLKTADGSYITTFVYSNLHPEGDANVTVSAMRFLNSSWVTVAQRLSDFEGKGFFFMYPWINYKIKAEKATIVAWVDSYYPNPNYVLRIYLEEEIEPWNFTWIFDTVSHRLEPNDTYLRDNWTIFKYYISSSAGDLEEYGMNITWNETVWNSTVDTSPSGGVIEINFTIENDTLAKTGNVYVTTWFNKTGYEQYSFTRKYTIWFSASYLPDILGALGSGSLGLSAMAANLIALIVSMVGAGYIGKYHVVGGSIVFLIILSFFVFMGWFTVGPFSGWFVFAALSLIAVAIIVTRSGIFG